eukprot:1469504-Prymnesium_polylepis.1
MVASTGAAASTAVRQALMLGHTSSIVGACPILGLVGFGRFTGASRWRKPVRSASRRSVSSNRSTRPSRSNAASIRLSRATRARPTGARPSGM